MEGFLLNERATIEDHRSALEMQTHRLTVRMGVMPAAGLTILGAILMLRS